MYKYMMKSNKALSEMNSRNKIGDKKKSLCKTYRLKTSQASLRQHLRRLILQTENHALMNEIGD